MMSRADITAKLQDIFRDVFDDETIILSDDMTSDDIEDWDSLSHINLIVEIEAAFDISLTTIESIEAQNVGELIDIIQKKL